MKTRPKRPVPSYAPTPGSWSTGRVEVANPVSIYPKYKPMRSLFMPDAGGVSSFTVEITTDKGIKGYGRGGPGGGPIIEGHLTKLLMDENALDIEKLWDLLWRATMFYGRKGVVVNAISGVDLALWDIAGKAWGLPVYRLLGGETKPRIPSYCTGNDIEQHVEFGYTKLKLALPYGPADGREGIRKNVELVKRARAAVGRDGEVMMDCWMALTERYTLELCEAFEPYRVYWMEECLPPGDYAGFGRLREQIKSTRIVTGEHVYTRYGFRGTVEAPRGGDLAAGHPLVRRVDGDAADRGAGGGLRHPGDPARRRAARCGAFHHGDAEQPLGRDVHAGAGRTGCGLRALRAGQQLDARSRGDLYQAVG